MKIRIVRVILLCAILAGAAYVGTHYYREIATALLGPQLQETCKVVRNADSIQHVCTFTKRW